MALQPFQLSEANTKRANAWLRLIDEHIAFDTVYTFSLERLRRKLVAHTTSDGLFAMWIAETADLLDSELRFARDAYERAKGRRFAA